MTRGYKKDIKLCEYCGEQIQHCFIGQKYHKTCVPAAYNKRKRMISANLSEEKREKRNSHQRWLTSHNRKIVIDHYGGKCECCGQNQIEFLCIDHIFGNGNEHRRINKIQSGGATINWIIKNNFPKEFRVLCHNCNMSFGMYGYCPHHKD